MKNKLPGRSGPYSPEYKRLGVTPVVIPATVSPQSAPMHRNVVAANRPHQPVSKVKLLEQEAEQINAQQFLQEEISLEMPAVDDYQYVLFHQGKVIEILPSKEEAEEYLDNLFFQEQSGVDPESLMLFRKIPIKIGTCILD